MIEKYEIKRCDLCGCGTDKGANFSSFKGEISFIEKGVYEKSNRFIKSEKIEDICDICSERLRLFVEEVKGEREC